MRYLISFVLMGIAIAISGVALLAGLMLYRDAEIYDSQTDGTVTESMTGMHWSTFNPSCRYEYRVGNTMYRGYRSANTTGGYYRYWLGAPIPLGYQAGDTVTVYYNSSDPSVAVLFPRLPLVWIIASVVAWLLALAYLVKAFLLRPKAGDA